MTVTTPAYRKHWSGVTSGLSLGTRLPNLKFLSSAVLELLAFNAHKFTGSHDRDHAHFLETFVRVHVGTIPGNTPAKFEVRIFSRFRAISISRPEMFGVT